VEKDIVLDLHEKKKNIPMEMISSQLAYLVPQNTKGKHYRLKTKF